MGGFQSQFQKISEKNGARVTRRNKSHKSGFIYVVIVTYNGKKIEKNFNTFKAAEEWSDYVNLKINDSVTFDSMIKMVGSHHA